MQRKLKKLLGYEIDTFNINEAAAYTAEILESGSNAQVVTINPEMIELAKKNEKFSDILKSADLVIPDGVGIKLGFKICGENISQVPGIEYSKEVIKMCEKLGYTVGFLGAKEEILQGAIKKLLKEFPDLKIGFQKNGYFDEPEEAEIVEKIGTTDVRVLFVALGAPKQEFFIAKYKDELKNTIMIGVGGSFDVWSGQVKRAPLFYRKIGCEWLYRLITQPYRFRRIFPTLPIFLFNVIICRNRY